MAITHRVHEIRQGPAGTLFVSVEGQGASFPRLSGSKPYNILGRHIGENRMDFAVVLKKESDMPF